MSFDEIEAFLKAKENQKKDEWEKVRLQCFYSVAAINGTKAIKTPKDLFILPWEKKKRAVKKITKEDLEKKIKQVQRFLKK